MSRSRRRLTFVLAVLSVLLAGLVSGGTPAAVAEGHRLARPVIDTRYLYDQLFLMSTAYIYRVSGAESSSPTGRAR
ncbi:MAG: hypothetical protein E6J41_01460 [Chloroflexi bacterium]|nr:MAG: hypothetical protein E6J41_01460 [Chloroflexota bacterium]